MPGLTHVGHDGREQMGNALIDRQLQHLRVDQDQTHLIRVRFVQQRQNGGVDTHRFAGPGGAGHQQMRHLGKVGHDRVAGDVFAERDGETGDAVVVDFRAENFGQTNDLPFRIRQFKTHVIFTGNRLDHPNRRQRQRTREVAGKADDLAALDTDGRFDFVTRNDRPRIGGDDLGGHTEVTEFFLDQATGEFQRLDTDRHRLRRRFIEQGQRRQIGVS